MKKKTMLRHIWNLLDVVDDKIENIETKIDLLETNDLDYHEQKILELIEDNNDIKKEIMEIKSMISNISNQIAAKEEPKETTKAETPVVKENKEEVKEELEQKVEEKKAPAKKSTRKTSAKK